MSDTTVIQSKSQMSEVWRRFKKNRFAVAGLIVLSAVMLVAIFAPIILDYDTDVIGQDLNNRLQPPSWEHPMGTDNFGRDIFSRVLYGSRVSLIIGFTAVGISLAIGGLIGVVSAYFGKWWDSILMRIMDVLLAVPGTLLAIAIVAALGPGMVNLVIAMTISFIPSYARLLRSLVLPIRDMEYIDAARVTGIKVPRIIMAHILPNTMGPILVQSTLAVGRIIIVAAGLSFLGLGILPPSPEWGAMLSEGRDFMRNDPYIVLFPGLAIMVTVLALNLLGDGLNDALDPRLNN